MRNLNELAAGARQASYILAKAGSARKDDALAKISELLRARADEILAGNEIDLRNAREKGIAPSMIDRLALTRERIDAIADGVMQVRSLPDPVGEVVRMWERPNGLKIGQKRVPLGVIGIIYEARPNVTVDAAALCLKSSNTVILRGGSEAIHSNTALAKVMREALACVGLPEDCICFVKDTSRAVATEMMKLNGFIDVLIPRGGAGLIRSVVMNATVPVIETGTGNCHVYVDATADLEMAKNILVNAKCQRPSVCNAAESLLVHKDVAEKFLPMAAEGLAPDHVAIHGCPRTMAILGDSIAPATDEDYGREYLGYEISCKVVDSLDEAIEHINRFNTGHSECIVTRDYDASQRFLEEVDAAAVYVNASTRFTDGFEFDFGAEIGISTQKLHARGPMGLTALTTTKYIIYGNGQVR